MIPRLSGHFPIFGLDFFVLKSPLGMQNNEAVKSLQFRLQSPQSNVRILLHQTWAIVKSLPCAQTSPLPQKGRLYTGYKSPAVIAFQK